MEAVLQSIRAWFQVSFKRKVLLLLALASPVLALIKREVRLALFRRIFIRSTPSHTAELVALINGRADAIEAMLNKQSRLLSRLDKAIQDLANRKPSTHRQQALTTTTPFSTQAASRMKAPAFAAELLQKSARTNVGAGQTKPEPMKGLASNGRRVPAFAAELLQRAGSSSASSGKGQSSTPRKKFKQDRENVGSAGNVSGGNSLFDQITRVKLKKTSMNRSPGGTPTPTKGGQNTSPSLARNAGEYLELALKRKFDNTMTVSSPNPNQVRKRAEYEPHVSPSNWPRQQRRV